MGNTHDSEVSRIEADFIQYKWKTTEDYRWGYNGERGPETWWMHYPSASGGKQSPVDIITEETWSPDPDNNKISKLEINYYSSSIPSSDSRFYNITSSTTENSLSSDVSGSSFPGMCGEFKIIINNGNTCKINFYNSKSYVTGGPFPNYNFSLHQILLHWGENDKNGSEHQINGKAYAAELQIIHWNEDLYNSYEEASKKDNGILAFSIFIQLSDNKSNDALSLWSELLEDILYRGESLPLPKEFPYKLLIPSDTDRYWSYNGSFTSPPCFETVNWIVFESCIYTSSKVLSKFRSLKSYCENEARPSDEFDGMILTNKRPTQPIGIRKICHVDYNHFRSFNEGEGGGGGGGEWPFQGTWRGFQTGPFRENHEVYSGKSGLCYSNHGRGR